MCTSSEPRHIESQFSTPESTIFYYWNHLAAKDYQKALSCFHRYQEKSYNEKDIFPLPDVESLHVDRILNIIYQGKKRVAISYQIAFYSKQQQRIVFFQTGDRLLLTSHGWKIYEVISSK